jgi:hypothetical protein
MGYVFRCFFCSFFNQSCEVSRFPADTFGNRQQPMHLCIRPSPRTRSAFYKFRNVTKYYMAINFQRNYDLWRNNNMSLASPLQFYREGVPPSQRSNGGGIWPATAGGRFKRQINNNNLQGRVPEFCTVLQRNIDSNSFGTARRRRRRREITGTSDGQ